jgi:hypothetical protein
MNCFQFCINFAFNLDLRRCCEDPANSARIIVRFADGTEVSAKREHCCAFL